jgi:FKBP-type peptidyl-prolyl cis-trans isomerase (trigger factor)
MQAGAAATSTMGNISERELSSQVQESLTSQGLNADAPDAAQTNKTLNRLILGQLVNELATRMGIDVTQGQVDSQLANYEAQNGGAEAVKNAFVSNGIPASQIPSVILINLQAAAIAKALAPKGSQEEQNAALTTALAALSKELDVTVSPRFGTWDAAAITVGPTPFDLSAPPKGLRAA